MIENDELGYKSKYDLNQKDDINMILNNKTESYIIMKSQKVKSNKQGKKKCLIDYEELKNEDNLRKVRTRNRCDSVDLYKKHKREKKKKSKKKKSTENIKNYNCNVYKDENEIKNLEKENTKNLRFKKVSFLKPNFITIIDVESYKKYNEENTYKDPFEDIELINDHKNIYKNEIDTKERTQCTCIFF